MAKQAYSRGWPGRFTALFFVLLSLLAAREMRLGDTAAAVSGPMEAVVNTLVFYEGENKNSADKNYQRYPSLRESYTGIAPVDLGLRYLVAAFLPAVAGWDRGFQVQQIYFLVSFFAVTAIWSVEAGRRRSSSRKGNSLALTSMTSIWALFYQTVGGAVIIPLYYLAYMRESAQEEYWTPASRQVSVSYAKALLPSLVVGYLLPTTSMYLPFSDPSLSITQGLIALWQFSPLIVNLLLSIISTAYGKEEEADSLEEKTATSPPPAQHLKYLKRLYLTSFAVSAIVHIGTISLCLASTDPKMTFMQALVCVPVSGRTSLAGGLHYIFQVDFWIIFAAVMAGAFVALWDLKRFGKTDLSLSRAAAGMAVAAICVGPAATVTGVWYIREQVLARMDEE